MHVDARGQEAGALTVTSAVRGLFKDNPATRAEAMSFIGQAGRRSERCLTVRATGRDEYARADVHLGGPAERLRAPR